MTESLTVTLDSVVSKDDQYIHQKVDDEIVLMNPHTGAYFGLSPIGARILELMLEPVSVRSVCDQLLKDYKVEREVLENDVLELVQSMLENSVVKLAK
jgi:hypothetical protein